MRLFKNSFLILALVVFFICSKTVFAADITKTTEVRATVGQFTLSIYGFVSPNASIILKSDNTLLATGIADAKGDFSFVKIPIKSGFTGFCLEAVDQHRLGKSTSCLTVPPAKADIILRDIYLAPTIGLERTTITVGSSGLAFGYTMPKARVKLSGAGKNSLTTAADPDGRYGYTIGNLQAGEYNLAAKGNYQGKDSLDPSQTVKLRVLTSSETFSNGGIGLRRALQRNLLWIILVGIGLSGLLTYLLYRLKPGWFTWLTKSRLFIFLFRRRHKLHHSWFIGY